MDTLSWLSTKGMGFLVNGRSRGPFDLFRSSSTQSLLQSSWLHDGLNLPVSFASSSVVSYSWKTSSMYSILAVPGFHNLDLGHDFPDRKGEANQSQAVPKSMCDPCWNPTSFHLRFIVTSSEPRVSCLLKSGLYVGRHPVCLAEWRNP